MIPHRDFLISACVEGLEWTEIQRRIAAKGIQVNAVRQFASTARAGATRSFTPTLCTTMHRQPANSKKEPSANQNS